MPEEEDLSRGVLRGARALLLTISGALLGDLGAVVRRACRLWHLTWGLHLRLGPGLDWLLRRPDLDSRTPSRARDIRDGALRALATPSPA